MSLVERAYTLARSGSCSGLVDLRKSLKREGFSWLELDLMLNGARIRKDLRELCAQSVKARLAMLDAGTNSGTDGCTPPSGDLDARKHSEGGRP